MGAKEGCAEGECGACTVVVVEPDGGGSRYQPVNSCLLFAPAAIGREILTVEALAQEGKLAEVQQAMAAAGGSQCGYCTPGFVMSLFAEQYRPGRTGACDPHALSGNLCRCTGYRPIRDAALAIGPAPEDRFRNRLAQPAPELQPLTFECGEQIFYRPANLEACLDLAARLPEAKWISGATDLAVESNLRFRRWTNLISLEGVAELQEFAEEENRVLLGGALTLDALERRWISAPDAFRSWVRSFASPLIRNRATLGGSLATASPIGDAAPLLLALRASLHLSSARGNRIVALADFFTGFRQTLLAPGELIRSIEIPKPFPTFVRYYKASKRRMDDISTVAAGLSLGLDARGRIAGALFAFGGVAATPLVSTAAVHAAVGQPWNSGTLQAIQESLRQELRPISDHRGSAEYRIALVLSFIEKFYRETLA